MVDDREHERFRFDRMDERQLWTRLGRITKENKLLYFAREAAERGLTSLGRAALMKYRQKTGVEVSAPWVYSLYPDRERFTSPSSSMSDGFASPSVVGAGEPEGMFSEKPKKKSERKKRKSVRKIRV